MEIDLLEDAEWTCGSTPPGAVDGPEQLQAYVAEWWSAKVPGTAAGALRDGGGRFEDRDFDASDWWFRSRFNVDGPPGPWVLSLGGLATIADVWLNGTHLLHSENMFIAHELDIAELTSRNELVIRCAALSQLLAVHRPRPRWPTYLVSHRNLRWYRTSLLGRMPGWAETPMPVGPWRPISLRPTAGAKIVSRELTASCDGAGGVVEVRLGLSGALEESPGARLHVGDSFGPLAVHLEGDQLVVSGQLRIETVQRWWPHTHGPQPLYPVGVEVGTTMLDLGRVGFRTIEVDRDEGAFRVLVNGSPVFCRGACWMPPDAVSMAPDPSAVRSTLALLAEANMNMVRIAGTTVYEGATFWDTCDELGILVWQDCMFAFMDPPDDEAFRASVTEELEQVFAAVGARPSLAVVCGGQEIEEQAAMVVPRADRAVPLIHEHIPALVDRLLPGVTYLTSNPSGGDQPIQMNAGVSQYFGVGGYFRPPEDARRAEVRFACECLAFSIPPERETIEDCGGAIAAGHDWQWKRSLHHDAGRSWDSEDTRDHYVRLLFGVDPLALRYMDAERNLDLGRATIAELMSSVFTEWRSPASTCDGGLVLALRDLRLGPGWGLIDAYGRPKAPWFALRRVLQPVAVLMTDEGLNGLRLHLVNDTAEEVAGTLRFELFARGEISVEKVEQAVSVPARGARLLESYGLLDAFQDVSYAYRFGPPAYDVVVATLIGSGGDVVSRVVHLPRGLARDLEPDVGMTFRAWPGPDGSWAAEITSRRFAQDVMVDVPGYRPSDSWFHLPPGAVQHLCLLPAGGREQPRGFARALNSQATAPLLLHDRKP